MTKRYELTYKGCLVVYVEGARDKEHAMDLAQNDANMGDWEWDEIEAEELKNDKDAEVSKRHAMVRSVPQ